MSDTVESLRAELHDERVLSDCIRKERDDARAELDSVRHQVARNIEYREEYKRRIAAAETQIAALQVNVAEREAMERVVAEGRSLTKHHGKCFCRMCDVLVMLDVLRS